jgi:hypothetical protein
MGENKSFTELVKGYVDIYPDLKKDKTKFSDFVIAKFIMDFMHDPQITGEHEAKIDKAKLLYASFINAWEELYGNRDQQD